MRVIISNIIMIILESFEYFILWMFLAVSFAIWIVMIDAKIPVIIIVAMIVIRF